jgi:monothiol glutaredoxin
MTGLEKIEQTVSSNKVVLYMKGNPEQPMCGFSARAAGILMEIGVPFVAVDVMADPEVREAIKEYGNWPTIPQLYINKELIGGSDIMMEMFSSGELQDLLKFAGALENTSPAQDAQL